MSLPSPHIPLSGGRFRAVYQLACADAEALALELAVEQTVEFPLSHVPAGDIREQIVGRVETVEEVAPGVHRATISYADEIAAGELTQLLNILFGNVALKTGVRLVGLEPSPGLTRALRGPRFGAAGLRRRLRVSDRPLVSTAVKPMGLPPRALADMAYTCARGGIDVIKDDHGLTNQAFCPFRERVARCAEAVARANAHSGLHAIYVANVTAPSTQLLERAYLAKELGADGVLVAPGIAGLDALAALSDDEDFDLPILAHPTLFGHLAGDASRGVSHRVLYGELLRLAGADASIFLSYGGRFPDGPDACREVIAGCREPLAGLAPLMPMPAGGVTLDRLPELVDFYGWDVMFLVGGGLHTAGDDLAANCRQFREAVERLLV